MASSSRDRLSVDLHGLKVALIARAQVERASVSAVVRRAMQRELALDAPVEQGRSAPNTAEAAPMVRLSMRMALDDAKQLDEGARRAGLSRGAFVAGLLAAAPLATNDLSSRRDRLTAITASSAELSTLSRNVHQLAVLLRQGDVQAALEYRRKLATLNDDVRAHLRLASSVLADLRPACRAEN